MPLTGLPSPPDMESNDEHEFRCAISYNTKYNVRQQLFTSTSYIYELTVSAPESEGELNAADTVSSEKLRRRFTPWNLDFLHICLFVNIYRTCESVYNTKKA